MRRFKDWCLKLLVRRRIARDFARLRTELMEIDRRVAEQPWWGDLPADQRRRTR